MTAVAPSTRFVLWTFLFQDRDALVDLMLDFVEAMNPEVKFKREFTVLKDRDLTGELKDIWLAIQVKREREKGKAENGKKLETGDRDKHKEGRDEESWQDSDKQQEVKTTDQYKEIEERAEALPMWISMEHEQNTEKGSKGTEYVEARNTVLPSNQIHTKLDQEHDKKCIVSCEGNKEEEMTVSSFNTNVSKLGEVAVRQITNSVHAACKVLVTPSKDSKSSPTHQRRSKMRSCKGDLFTQTVQCYDEVKNGKGGEFSSDIPHVKETSNTKHTVFKEMFPSSSDSSEDEERGDFRYNDLYKMRDSGTVNIADSKQIVGSLQDARMSNVSQNLDDTDNVIDINDTAKNENASSSDTEPNSPQKVEEACRYGSTDFENSNVKPYTFLCMKSSVIKRSTDKHLSGKQNIYVANKFKNPEQTDYESAESDQADIHRSADVGC